MTSWTKHQTSNPQVPYRLSPEDNACPNMPAMKEKVSAVELHKSKDFQTKKVRYPFWFGGSASCFAACVTHPLDLGTYSP